MRWLRFCGRRARELLLLSMAAFAVPAAGQPITTTPGGDEYRPTIDQHTVQKGDTLWDLSARYAGSPWHWPRIWSYNPEITNPHWIYPGDLVRFQPSDQPLPHLAQLASSERELPEEQEPAEEVIEEADVAPEPRRAPRPSREQLSLFVSPKELAESGTLTNSISDKILLTPPDDVFITFPEGQRHASGQRYMVYRTVQEVKHPRTHKRYGYMTQITGFATMQGSAESNIARAKLTDAMVEIERGQRVAPLMKLPSLQQQPTTSDRHLEGVVLAVQPGEQMAGQRQIVFVDLGASSGLKSRNRLVVYTDRDPLHPKTRLPPTPIANLMVIDVRDNAATCIVQSALREIEPGLIVKTP